jgi:hypothetical protein
VLTVVRRRLRTLSARLALAAAVAAVGSSCNRPPVAPQRVLPSAEQLAATPNAVGIPYDYYLLIRRDDRRIALHVTSLSPLGDRVSYRWYLADGDGRFSQPETLEQGAGETVERPYTGRIFLPGPLHLDWSRGSTAFGWLYWPEQGGDYAVYSRPFTNLADVGAKRDGGRWLTRERFRR